ncbi:Golgi SNAP receptor complex member 1-like [Salvia hispanica]|uniref:Golgi SNAP receptor complex member 1-like n=1 Tax=Salvia hispanica TaxID=49212 RepID=UPI002009919C|nr:Golgi SNAP receptor complex member 1-like [Salvia hispanica]
MARCYMLASMSLVLKHQHSAMATAAEIMQNLANLFGTQNRTAKSQASRSIMTKTMKEDTSVSFQQFKLNFEMNKRDYTLVELLTELQSTEDLMVQAKERKWRRTQLQLRMLREGRKKKADKKPTGKCFKCERVRSSTSHIAKKEHASLLEDFREFDRTRLDLEDGGGSYDQALLKERAEFQPGNGQVDSVISQAQETLKSLVFQRSTFGGINSKLSNVGSRLPTVNHILSAIKKKKSMDTIILSLVASVCTFLILIYWWTK